MKTFTFAITRFGAVFSIAVLLRICAAAQDAVTGDRAEQRAQTTQLSASGKTRDSLWNGTLIGAGIGFATGFVGLAAFNAKATASGPIWDAEAIGYYTGAGLVGAGLGAGLGMVVDAVKSDVQSPLPRFRTRLAPMLGPRHSGALISIAF